ncbi:hypothetical protein [Holospora curviuscula]|nr:hypothetical protein [Holospora curviuscula]
MTIKKIIEMKKESSKARVDILSFVGGTDFEDFFNENYKLDKENFESLFPSHAESQQIIVRAKSLRNQYPTLNDAIKKKLKNMLLQHNRSIHELELIIAAVFGASNINSTHSRANCPVENLEQSNPKIKILSCTSTSSINIFQIIPSSIKDLIRNLNEKIVNFFQDQCKQYGIYQDTCNTLREGHAADRNSASQKFLNCSNIFQEEIGSFIVNIKHNKAQINYLEQFYHEIGLIITNLKIITNSTLPNAHASGEWTFIDSQKTQSLLNAHTPDAWNLITYQPEQE